MRHPDTHMVKYHDLGNACYSVCPASKLTGLIRPVIKRRLSYCTAHDRENYKEIFYAAHFTSTRHLSGVECSSSGAKRRLVRSGLEYWLYVWTIHGFAGERVIVLY